MWHSCTIIVRLTVFTMCTPAWKCTPKPIFWPGEFHGQRSLVGRGAWWATVYRVAKSPLDLKEIQPVHSEGDQPWDFFGRNDAKAETPVLWPPHVKS